MATGSLDIDALVDPAYRDALAAMPARMVDLTDVHGAVAAFRDTGMPAVATPPRAGVTFEDHFAPDPTAAPRCWCVCTSRTGCRSRRQPSTTSTAAA